MRFLACVGICLAFLSSQSTFGALMHRYGFNDGTARDSIAGADGQLVRGASVQGGQLYFDPLVNNGVNNNPVSGQYLDLPNNIGRYRTFSLELWFTWRGGGAWQRLVDFGNNASNSEILPSDITTTGYTGQSFVILTPFNGGTASVGQITLDAQAGAGYREFSAGPVIGANVEHHLVFTQNPDTFQQRLYLDGTMVNEVVGNLSILATDFKNNWLGRSQFQADPFFNGTIDELRIYNDALTPTDVQLNDAQGPNGQVSDGAATSTPEPIAGSALLALVVPLLRRRGRRE